MIKSVVIKYHILFLLGYFLFAHSENLYSQDHHYWMNMGGTRSALMGGAVVGGVRDYSAGYYNPAGLAFITQQGQSISSDTYGWENIKIENSLGGTVDFKSNQIQLVPSLVAGVFQVDFLPWLKIRYSIAAKEFSIIKSSDNFSVYRDVMGKIENGELTGNNSYRDLYVGEEKFSGQYLYDASVAEYWAGVSWSYKLNSEFAFGITMFLVYRSRSQLHSTNLFGTDQTTGRTAENQLQSSVEYWNVRLIPKFGIMWNTSRISAGLAVTSPSINLFGQGIVSGLITSQNINFVNTAGSNKLTTDYIINERQADLSSQYYSPLSVAAGLEIDISSKISFAITSEYFHTVSEYSVVQPISEKRDHSSELSELLIENNWLNFKDRKNALINSAIALEYRYNEKLNGYLSFRTDLRNNKYSPGSGSILGISSWNIYHLTAGALYKLENYEISLGIKGSYGSRDKLQSIINYPYPAKQGDDYFMVITNNDVKANYWLLGVILGFTYFID